MQGHEISDIAIVGAGIAGLMTAYQLSKSGHRLTIYDQGTEDLSHNCSWAAGGMLAPYCELESAESNITTLGERSLELWPEIVADIQATEHFHQNGSLVVAHRQDMPELSLLENRIAQAGYTESFETLDARTLAEIEPTLGGRFHRGLYFAQEGHLNPRPVLKALRAYLQNLGVEFRFGQTVKGIAPGALKTQEQTMHYDWVIDCRGLGSNQTLRGVKGEMLVVKTDEIHLSRPVRLMHPRHPLYIIPRGDGVFMIGATTIESESDSLTVKSALDLLSALYSLHPAFAEAEILETNSALRPAYPDHLPRLNCQPGLISLNGLYRHGYLLVPALSEQLATYITLQETQKLEATA